MFNPSPPMSWFFPTGGYTAPPVYTTNGVPNYATTQGVQEIDPEYLATLNEALAAAAQQNQFNNTIAQGGLNNQTQQIANTNAYQMALIQQAKDQLAQAAHQFEQNYGLQAGALTGMFNGQPTLANLGQQAQYTGYYNGTPTMQNIAQIAALTGMYNGNPTLAAQQAQQQFGLQQGALTGQYGGMPTQAAQQWAQQLALAAAGLTGQYGGDQTLAAQNQQFQQGVQAAGLTGQYQGAPTLAAQQLAQQNDMQRAGLGLQTLQLGASLGGPADWLNYQTAAAGARQNPLLAQGVASWADMTNGSPRGGAGWAGGALQPRTLGTLANDFGGGAGQPGAAPQGLTPQEQARLDQILARNAQLSNAGQGTVSPEDIAEAQRYLARGGRPTSVAPQTPSTGPNRGAMFQQPGGGWANGAGAGGAAGVADSPVYAGGSATFNESGGGGVTQKPNANATADYMARVGQRTNEWSPNFWNSLNPDQQDMYKNAWEKSGQSSRTVLANASRNRITQGWAA